MSCNKKKIKTKKSFKKRVKLTKTGKIMRACSCKNHLRRKKTKKQKRHLRKRSFISKTDLKREKYLLQ